MGQEAINQIWADWISMATHWAGFKWQQLEGIVINLLQSEYSEREIQAIIPVDDARIDQLRNVLKNGIDTLHTHHPPHIHVHTIHGNDMDAIKADAKTWEVDDEFPCTHRCPKQYLLDVTLTFTKLHQRYKAKIEASNDGARIVSYLRWIQYVHLFYLGLGLACSAETYATTVFELISSSNAMTFLLTNVITY
jgi:hypothetical protein